MTATTATRLVACLLLSLLASCAEPEKPETPAAIRARIVRLMPASVPDRAGWAADIQTAFAALEVRPVTPNLCASLAVIEQESNFKADPVVPGLANIARGEIDRRAQRHHIPLFVVSGALMLDSPDGRTYEARLAAVRTEKDLNDIYEDFIGSVPMGKRLLGGANPVHTAGPMQVSIGFSEAYARERPYPYPVTGSIRHEAFTRRGGVYFGIAHLLDYKAAYPRLLYRFADYNAGIHASRNAAFQQAVSRVTGVPLALDGDLVAYGKKRDAIGATEAAVRSIAPRLDLTPAQIHRALQLGDSARFERTDLYETVFALADAQAGKPLPRAVMPRIRLDSPKITRQLTTEWFANRVEQRYRRCMVRAGT